MSVLDLRTHISSFDSLLEPISDSEVAPAVGERLELLLLQGLSVVLGRRAPRPLTSKE